MGEEIIEKIRNTCIKREKKRERHRKSKSEGRE